MQSVAGHAMSEHRLAPVTSESLELFKDVLQDVLTVKNGNLAPERRLVGRKMRGDTITAKLQSSQNPFDLLEKLAPHGREAALRQLVIWLKQLDFHQETLAADAEVKVNCKETALGLLRGFQDDLSQKALVKHILSSTKSNKTCAMSPRVSGFFDDLSDVNQVSVIAAMSNTAIKVAKVLLPKDTEDGA